MRGVKVLLLLSGGVLISTFGAQSLASTPLPYGWYVEGNAGASYLSKKSYPGSASTSKFGGNFNFGYKFMPNFTAEVGYSRYGSTNIKDSAGTNAATDQHYALDLAGKGIFPFSADGDVFAKLGVADVFSNVGINNSGAADALGISSGKHSATGFYLGLGAEYYFTSTFGGNIQWARASGNSQTGTLSLYSIGLSYIFG